MPGFCVCLPLARYPYIYYTCHIDCFLVLHFPMEMPNKKCSFSIHLGEKCVLYTWSDGLVDIIWDSGIKWIHEWLIVRTTPPHRHWQRPIQQQSEEFHFICVSSHHSTADWDLRGLKDNRNDDVFHQPKIHPSFGEHFRNGLEYGSTLM